MHEAQQWQQQSAPLPSAGLLQPPVHVAVLPVNKQTNHPVAQQQ